MKLKNKKTGEIINGIGLCIPSVETRPYGSLAELNEEWEDYEEPETFWYINDIGDVCEYNYDGGCTAPIVDAKQIGNYFETEEEAEKAAEKLKAWKRLKDKGFRFFNNKIIGEYGNVSYKLFYPATRAEEDDLDLLFRGE